MRRGMMDWQAEEVPAEFLAQRVKLVAEHCQQHGLSAMIFYSNFTRPSDISALTHFVPFWSQALLAISADGQSAIAMATTGRTVQWIRSSSVVDHVMVSGQIGHALADWMLQAGPAQGAQRIGVVHPNDIPENLLQQLHSRTQTQDFSDESAWWAKTSSSWSVPEVIQSKAKEITQAAFNTLLNTEIGDAHSIVAIADGSCRAQGAEEVAVYLAPSLNDSSLLRRLEGPTILGEQIAVQISLAYKGHWIRETRTFYRAGSRMQLHTLCTSADAALAQSGPISNITNWAHELSATMQCELAQWRLEGPHNGIPLATLCSSERSTAQMLPAPSHASLTLQLQTTAGPVLWGAPLTIAC